MPHTFPGYRLLERLHTSSRSTVDRAESIDTGARVVVKQAADDLVAAEALRRIHHEYELLRLLQGSGVVEVLELARDGGRAGLILQYLEPLAARDHATVEDALAIAIDLADALIRIHAAGVVHRDVNPHNICRHPATGVATLIDFDIASRAPACPVTSLEGSLRYLAPEQTGRLGLAVDARTDLYALGITLYELLAGAPPFVGDDALALVHAHLATPAPRLGNLVPSAVADIVAKLVAKAPEQRYQTARGVREDLVRCRRELADTGAIAAFELARHDVARRPEFTDKLFGRGAEVRALVDAFERIGRGGVETVLVAGYSGIGKSAVVREIYAPAQARGGYVGAGKFEQLNRSPYSAVVAALEQLIAQILTEPAIDRWRAGIAGALCDDGGLVRSVLPVIERLLGPQPEPPALDPESARRRIAHALARLVQVFARKAHPLVLFLDDMQWADAASLQLLGELAVSDDTESLLVVEAFRDNEVDATHPFALALRGQSERGGAVTRIDLVPLTLAETAELVADALRAELHPETARLIWRKTEGNPFFIRRFVHALHDAGAIVFDPDAGAFAIDVGATDRAAVTENVAELVARQIGKLPAVTAEALATGAALGTRFLADEVAAVIGRPLHELEQSLAPAIATGMIKHEGGHYCFEHDKIQEAAYAALPVAARARLHLAVGRSLLTHDAADVDARLFDIVQHLERGFALIEEPAERARVVDLCLEVARRACRSGAFDVAAAMLRTPCKERDEQTQHAAWFAAHLELARVLALGGRLQDARGVIRETTVRATPRERALLDVLETTVCTSLGLVTEAVACMRRATAVFGVDLPTDPAELARQIELDVAAIMARVATDRIESWIDLPLMSDPDLLAAMTAMVDAQPAAYQSEPLLFGLISSRLVALALRHGTCDAAARGFAAFTIPLWMMGKYETAHSFGRLAIAIGTRGNSALTPSVEFTYAMFASPWQRPIDESISRLGRTITGSIDVGDMAHAGYSAMFMTSCQFFRGASLGELVVDVRRLRKVCIRLGLTEIDSVLRWYISHARFWTGTAAIADEPDLDYATIEQALATSGSRMFLTILRFLELERRYWAGDMVRVLELGRSIDSTLDSMPASVFCAELRFYRCLAAIAVTGGLDADGQAMRDELARYGAACPANFGHMAILVDAELARARGDAGAAVIGYEHAIDAAAQHAFIKVETIAHELAARFWIDRARPAFAAVHLGSARDLCEHWGAVPRARALEVERRQLGAPSSAHATIRSTTASASTLDFSTIVKASHAIASDMVLESLLGKIMEIIVENTGAQTGAIVLEQDGALSVRASKQAGATVSVITGEPLALARDVSAGIVTYVTRTAECVVLADATRHPTFRSDPYVRARRPRSVLCLPIVHKDHMIGAVYLENNLVAGAFTVDRLDAVGILVGQLAISIENAMMFSRLEGLVAERTCELTDANQQLCEQALVRARMESELRLAQKLQSVGQLAAGVAHEINTPLQYVGDSIAFLDDALAGLLQIVEAYRAQLASGAADIEVLARLELELDLEFLLRQTPEACARARDGLESVKRIVIAMRAFSHPDRSEQTPMSLESAIANTLVVARNEYRDVADVVTDFGGVPDVCCHVGELNQVFLNLIVNAAHAIDDAGRGRGSITICTRRESHDTVLITIADTGTGIPDTIRDRVFDPFFTTKGVGRGTGQGLALARSAVVDRHAGTIGFSTCIGKGTTFWIRLPIAGRARLAS